MTFLASIVVLLSKELNLSKEKMEGNPCSNVLFIFRFLEQDIYFMLFFSYYSTQDKNENDMRFLYCACCISYILQDWNGLDKASAISYIRNSMVSLLELIFKYDILYLI